MHIAGYSLVTVGLLALIFGSTAEAGSPWQPRFAKRDLVVMDSVTYQNSHPDHKHFREGMEAWHERRYQSAHASFLKAAYLADKASQAVLGEMYWTGKGVPRDRVRAYVWMDLAAERMYARYLGHRERYWEQLTAAEREQAQTLGEQLYAEYGDQVAKPRMEDILQRGRAQLTGSRVGSHNPNRVYQGLPPMSGLGSQMVSGPVAPELVGFADSKFWQPSEYWAFQDEAYHALKRSRRLTLTSTITLGPEAQQEKRIETIRTID